MFLCMSWECDKVCSSARMGKLYIDVLTCLHMMPSHQQPLWWHPCSEVPLRILQLFRAIVAHTTIDCLINHGPSDLGLLFFSDFRQGLDPVFWGFPVLYIHMISLRLAENCGTDTVMCLAIVDVVLQWPQRIGEVDSSNPTSSFGLGAFSRP